MPAVILAFAGGTLLAATLTLLGDFGFALVLATPFGMGAVIGYAVRERTSLVLVLVAAAVIFLAVTLMTLELMGMICGGICASILVGPAFLGALAGIALRYILKHSNFSQRFYFPLILLFGLPVIVWSIEQTVGFDPDSETIITTRIVDGTPEELWESIQFYEEVEGHRPRLLVLALPKPLYTRGSIDEPGDEKQCVYDKGHITKRVTEVKPGEVLAFDVIEQIDFENRSVRLISGRFLFEPVDECRTRITLETTYEPKLQARPIWRPYEIAVTRELHEHVIFGMEQTATRRRESAE